MIGGPTVILFDTGSVVNRLAEWKGDLWNVAGIPTPEGDEETNQVVLLGYLVAWFMGEVGPEHCLTRARQKEGQVKLTFSVDMHR